MNFNKKNCFHLSILICFIYRYDDETQTSGLNLPVTLDTLLEEQSVSRRTPANQLHPGTDYFLSKGMISRR